MLTIEINSNVAERLNGTRMRALQAIKDGVGEAMIKLARTIRDEKLTGQVLKNRTGTLRRSIQEAPVEEAPGSITGAVFQDNQTAPYGKAQEYGATIHLPEIVPVRRMALANVESGWGPYRRARAHDVTLPERSFMRSALNEQAADIRATIQENLNAVIG